MATAIQRRRGNTAQHASFTGLAGEITIDTDKNTVVVHDGVTAGGYPLAKADDVEALGGADITAVVAGNGLTGGATSGNATINVVGGAGITVSADNVAVNTSYYDVTNGGTGWTGNLEPSANNTYSLGSATNVWKDLFVGPNSIRIGGVALSLTNGVLTFGGSNVAVAGSASSNADTRGLFSASDAGGDGSFSYNSSTGVFTYTGPSQAEANARIDAYLAGGAGLTYSSGTFAVGAGDGIIVNPDNILVDGAYVKGLFSASDAGGDGSFSYNNGVFTYTGPSASEVRAHFSAGTGITLTNGEIATTITQYADSNARAAISVTDSGGDGSLSYNSSTGVLTYTGPSASEVRAHFSAGTGITVSSGVIAVDSTIATKDYANTAASNAVAAVIDAAPAALDTLNELAAALGDDANFSATITSSISTKLAIADFDSTANTWISTKSSTDLAEGTNLYFTAARARGNISVTDAGGDGSMSYDSGTGVITYTGPSASEVRAHFSAGTGVTLSSGQISIGQAVGTTANVTFNQVTADLVGDVTGNLTGDVTGTVSSLSNHDTADLAEGTNLYFTAARARGNVSATDAGGLGSFGYDSGTGVFTYTGPSDGDIRGLFSAGTGVTITNGQVAIGQSVGTTDSVTFNTVTADLVGDVTGTVSSLSNHDTADLAEGTNLYFTAARARGNISVTDNGGDGSLSYDSGTGVISYTGPSASEVRAHFSAGTGVTITNGQVAIGQAVGTTDSVTFKNLETSGNLVIGGNLTVSGNVVTISSESLTVEDNMIYLNDGANSNVNVDLGIVGNYNNGTNYAHAGIFRDATDDRWKVFKNLTVEPGVEINTGHASFALADFQASTIYGNLTGNVTGTVSSLSNHDTADLAEGTNLYFTAARARGNISVTDNGGDGSLSYDSGTGVISYTGPSQAEANARMDAYLVGGPGLTYVSGSFAVGAGAGITVNADNVSLSTSGVSAGTYGSATEVAQVTVDSYGRVTSVTNVTISGDITEVVAGSGLTGGGATGAVTLNVVGGFGIVANADSIELSNSSVRGLFSGSTGVDYNSSTGAITLASSTGGSGLTYSSGVLAVGAGNYITVAADSVAVDATTTATASKVAARDASGDLYANIFQGTASSARYADLAERYEADAILEPGTVVCFGGEKEITACDHENDHAVAGVVSTDPAYMMNSAAGNNDTHPYIALTGRVPVKVVGPVAKGDLLVASGVKGHAMANNNAKAGTIIGKAIGSSDAGEGVVEALINLM